MSGMYIGDEYEKDYCVLLNGVLTFFIDTLEGESGVPRTRREAFDYLNWEGLYTSEEVNAQLDALVEDQEANLAMLGSLKEKSFPVL